MFSIRVQIWWLITTVDYRINLEWGYSTTRCKLVVSMSASEIDFLAFFLILSQYILGFLAVYIVILLVLRFSNYYRVNNCPNCSRELKRSQRQSSDRLVNTLSFGILPIKRYRCYTCYWEGQALGIKNQSKRDLSFKEDSSAEEES